MTVQFEIKASVILLGNDLQFTGTADDGARVKFVVTGEALQRLAKSAVALKPQEKFKVFDRNRAWVQETARRIYDKAPAKLIKIRGLDV